jgi:acyl-CoA thioesterase
MTLTAQERADACAAKMWADDAATKFLGLDLVSVSPGRATVSMQVQAHHLNGHSICHGGFIFTLADTAFAYACNTYNRRVVAQQNTITYLRPGQVGDALYAEAVEQVRAGRSGIYDVTVRSSTGLEVALFRGNSREIPGSHFDESAQ